MKAIEEDPSKCHKPLFGSWWQLKCKGSHISFWANLLFFVLLILWSHHITFSMTSEPGGLKIETPNGTSNYTLASQSKYKNTIPVNIQIKPAHYLHGKNYIATNANVTATAEITDDKFKNVSLEYEWVVKNKTIAKHSNASQIVYTFDKPDDSDFLGVVVSHHPNDTGMSNKSLVIRDPIVIQQPIGKLFLEHGELLDISLNFSGTGPYAYCLKFCLEKKTTTECSECSPDIVTKHNQVTIIKYLHQVANYTLLFVVDNIASRVKKNYSVRIIDTIRPKTIPFVPIVSSVLAVIIVLSGVALHMRFKQSFVTETADFDFIRHDYNEDDDFWDEEQSFLQRVRYLLCKAGRDQDTSMSDSILTL